MSGINIIENTRFNVDNEHVDRLLKTINTSLIGKISSIDGNKASVNISNKYPKLMLDGTIEYVPYGTVTTNFAVPSLFKYVPQVSDVVIIIVFQTNSQNELNNDESDYPHSFNIFDSVLIPVSISYSDDQKIELGLSNLDIDLVAKDFIWSIEKLNATLSSSFNLSTTNFSITNSLTSENLLSIIAQTFSAIGSVTVGDQTIDELTGGLVSTNSSKITDFS